MCDRATAKLRARLGPFNQALGPPVMFYYLPLQAVLLTIRLNSSYLCIFVVVLHFCFHYANKPMQYTVILHSCKNDNFQIKNCDIFLIFAQTIDCGYTTIYV